MVNKPLIRPYFWGGVALGGAARIPMISTSWLMENFALKLVQWECMLREDVFTLTFAHLRTLNDVAKQRYQC